ncbi:hypothetical protein DNTS_015414 [Danionella cerebrum]|uniref:Uncharacterized protein n=1 Tax=Danionella cerebrum TaxID=2873325 RepID=A0A553R3T4_9TELE|nr:hypothetical protein DNTS_015414 [Danionella translucida]
MARGVCLVRSVFVCLVLQALFDCGGGVIATVLGGGSLQEMVLSDEHRKSRVRRAWEASVSLCDDDVTLGPGPYGNQLRSPSSPESFSS